MVRAGRVHAAGRRRDGGASDRWRVVILRARGGVEHLRRGIGAVRTLAHEGCGAAKRAAVTGTTTTCTTTPAAVAVVGGVEICRRLHLRCVEKLRQWPGATATAATAAAAARGGRAQQQRPSCLRGGRLN